MDKEKLIEYMQEYSASFLIGILIIFIISYFAAEMLIGELRVKPGERVEKYQEINISIGVIRTVATLVAVGIAISKF